jgi:osmotically-inducible protein OsmY
MCSPAPKEVVMRIRTLVVGGLVGAAIAYLYDPVSGRGRRAQLRDRGRAESRRIRERADAKKRHLSNVTRGVMSEMSSPGPDDHDPDDATIAQRIQSEVFGSADVPKDRIALTVVDGVAELRGELDAQEDIDALFIRVSAVPGVGGVQNLLRVHGAPAPNKKDAIRASNDAERRAS